MNTEEMNKNKKQNKDLIIIDEPNDKNKNL